MRSDIFIYDSSKGFYRLLKHYFQNDYRINVYTDYFNALAEASKLSVNTISFIVVNNHDDLAVLLMLISKVDLIFVCTSNSDLRYVLTQNSKIHFLDMMILKTKLIKQIKKQINSYNEEGLFEHKNVS